MTLDNKEDQTAPVSEQEVLNAAYSTTLTNDDKLRIINKILDALNEKRDAYNGIVSSIIYIIDSHDAYLNNALKEGLIEFITCRDMRFGGKMFILKALPRLTSEKPLFIIEFFEQVVEATSEWSKNFEQEGEILRIQIISIKAIRQAEQIKGGRATRLAQQKVDQLCADAIFCCDDSTKIDTLSLVLESRSTTKPLKLKELNLFKALYRDAISLQEPSLRQIFIALTNKLIKRIKDSHRVVMRDTKRYSDEQRNLINLEYMQFLTWLTEFCFDSIYCNAYFGSFILTISTLKLIIQHITFDNEDLSIISLFDSRRCYDSILTCLNDSFEENKTLALELLLYLPYNEEFISDDNLNCFEEIAYQLVGSVNPAHSLTCQYIFKLIVGLRKKQTGSKLTKNQLLHQYLSKLVGIVEEGVRDTQENFVLALKRKPIYPKLTCIRALLDDIDINDMENDRQEWETLAKRIVISSIDACKAVSTIVCNLNPETIGHLPMDLKPIDVDNLSQTLNISLKISNGKLNTITSQMLLISGWKTIKECSLSLGSLCTRFWWPIVRIKMRKEKFPGLKTNPILDSNDIIKIINFFDHYLRNLRHRGAFEQAYNGFMMVTRRIWHDEQFKNLLIETLNQIMEDFKNEAMDGKKVECLKAYVTRRSAGLPFIVQAILNSEHKHDSKILRWVMDCLIEILENKNSEVYQVIHCLNILRALVKEHFLGEKVLSYIGKTFAITMESFKSDSFSIRNCASMLLKATIDRTFGVNRLRDDIHRRNQLSFERFFTECPDLHQKMIQNLKDGLNDRRYLAAVHSVFIVLFRLRPSLNPNDNYSTDKIIKPFIKPILELAYHCPDYKLRGLAAKLVVRLENFCQHDDKQQQTYLSDLRDFIFNKQLTQNRNRLHGSLLLTKNWVESYSSSSDNDQQHCNFLLFAQQVVREICLSNIQDTSSTIKMVALDLAESCCLNRSDDNQWLMDINSMYDRQVTIQRDPHSESLIFRYVTILLMGAFPNDQTDITIESILALASNHGLNSIVILISEIITRESNQTFSMNLQASLIRFFRQLFNESDDFIDKLLDKLDLDLTAAHMTPFDKVRFKSENDSKKKKLVKYCEQNLLKQYLKQSIPIDKIFNFTSYKEFQPISRESDTFKFSPRYSNTPRSIELMAFAYKSWDDFDLEKNSIWYNKEGESRIEKLNFLSQFISSLPDCDAKCLALLCAGKLMVVETKQISNDNAPLEPQTSSKLKVLENFSKVLDELSDGDHSLIIRETCCEILRLNMKEIVDKKYKHLQGCLMNFFSALMKLSQDEEREVRLFSHRVMLTLNDRAFDKNGTSLIIGSRLDHLIKLIATQLFDPSIPEEMNKCFDLLMRIIFNHSRNYSNDVKEEKERLFDKTKLNTFADHVSIIQSSLEGLQMFFNRLCRLDSLSELVDLRSLRLPQDILLELKIIDSPTDDNTGDYSWRLKKVIDGLPGHETVQRKNCQALDNNQIVDEFLDNVLKSLDYFAKGYWNMLTDTEYTYHELSLYKRVVFIKFVLQCTKHDLKNQHLVIEIREAMQRIVTNSCSTTLLYKCLNLLD